MKLLLDECVPRQLKAVFVGHECHTVTESGFMGKVNGELLSSAERSGFDVLVTVDKGLEYQQNFEKRRISVLILYARSSQLIDLLPLAEECLAALNSIKPGSIVKAGFR
jgi:hypothetical protein